MTALNLRSETNDRHQSLTQLLPVQEGSSIMTLMTKQETMEKNSLYNISIHQLPNTLTQLK